MSVHCESEASEARVGVIHAEKTIHAIHANHDPFSGRFVILKLFQITVQMPVSGLRVWTVITSITSITKTVIFVQKRSNFASFLLIKGPLSAKMLLNHGFFHG